MLEFNRLFIPVSFREFFFESVSETTLGTCPPHPHLPSIRSMAPALLPSRQASPARREQGQIASTDTPYSLPPRRVGLPRFVPLPRHPVHLHRPLSPPTGRRGERNPQHGTYADDRRVHVSGGECEIRILQLSYRSSAPSFCKAAIILSASVTFLSLPGLDSVARVAGFVTILCSAASMASSVVALFRYKADLEHATSTVGGEGLMMLSVSPVHGWKEMDYC